jgi:hypothetical protein
LSVAARSVNSLSMKPRHTAALAFLGWFLMLPPTHGGYSHFYTDEALRKWCRGDYSDTLAECKQLQQRRIREFKAAGQKEPIRLKDADYYALGQCVAEDDPRLKESK